MHLRWAVALPLALTVVAGGLAAPALTTATAQAATATSLSASRVQETATGTARTIDVPGVGYAVVHSFGAISMVGADGKADWQLSTQQLYRDWNLTWENPPSWTNTPQLAWGTNPVDPLEFTGAGTDLLNDVNPAAAGELDGTKVIAVAETAGSNLTAESYCGGPCTTPFDVPGSSVHVGTFVTVFDAQTGRIVYNELDPGYVTQLAITDGRLIIGEEDGDPQSQGGLGAWGSVSTVRALAITSHGRATQSWEYSTRSEWGRLLDVAVTQDRHPDAGVAIAWSDTPTGLGVPGPPAGHVLLLDAVTGTTRWQVRTPGYPVLAAADNQRGELAVVQESDPALSVGYTLTGLSYASGQTVLSAKRAGSLPISLAVGGGTDGNWAVGAADATVTDGIYDPTRGRVTLTSPVTGHDQWSSTIPSTDYGVPVPGGLVVADGTVVASSWLGPATPTAAVPLQQVNDIEAFSYRTGGTSWQQSGDPGDPLSLSAVTGGPGLVRTVNSHQDVLTYTAAGHQTVSTAAGPGDFLSAVPANVTSPGRTDLVAGDEDGDVTALDGRALSAGTERLLWQAHLPGPVQQLTTATVDGREVIVAAATSAVGVLDARTGRVLRVIQTPGTYAYTATVISVGGTPAVVVPGTSLTAYDLLTGVQRWSYAAPSGASFSDAAYADGVVAAEYSSAAKDNATPATQLAAVGLTAATGKTAWIQPASSATTLRGQLWNGVFASPDIAGANGHGVAFTWQNRDGETQVDVRNMATGTLDYSDTSELSAVTQYLATPKLGLIMVTQPGSALITPSGAESTEYASGISGAVATAADGQQAFLTADGNVAAYPTDIFTTSDPQLLASESVYQSGLLVSGDFAGNGTQQVVAIPSDWSAYQVVNRETGYPVQPNLVTIQRGMALLTLSDSGSAAGAGSGSAHTPASSDAGARYPASSQSAGLESPASPPARLIPVGQRGSTAPSPEPERTGAAQPMTSPPTVKHTITAAAASDAVDPPGYSPSQLGGYLKLTGDGKGQTIAIVDAYDDPDITSDTETFSQQYGLPGVCGAGGTAGNCFTLDVDQQSATAGSNGDWAIETSLDVEWAHAIAPDATIKLISASDDTFAALFRGVATAAAGHPAAVSMSWGINSGEFSDETYYDHFCAVSTTVCSVSAGDYGHPGSYPAYNPAVLAVGGTTLTLGTDGTVTSEQAWSGSGGGQSWVEPEPAYQDKAQSSGMREMPDVAFDADPNTGVAVYDSLPYAGQSGWWLVGGTSLGAPSWAAILAATDQLRAAKSEAPLTASGFAAQRAVYSLPASVLAPVTSGPANGFCPVGCTPGPGYDQITGMGSPRAGIDVALAAAGG